MRPPLASTLLLLAALAAATATASRPGRDGFEPAAVTVRRAGQASNAPTTTTTVPSRLTAAPETMTPSSPSALRLTAAPVTLLPPYNRGGLGAAAPVHESGYFKVRER